MKSSAKQWSFMSASRMKQDSEGHFAQELICSLAVCLIITVSMACESKPVDTSVVKQKLTPTQLGQLSLTPEELSRIQLELAAVVQGQILSHREFPATVQANQNELVEVTTLIRSRVVTVHVDVGQDVKRGALLSMLHSVDLGVAEREYLKAKARLEEAERSYVRAKELYDNKAVSVAELQRREAAMKTARAEVRGAQNRLQLLGVPTEASRR